MLQTVSLMISSYIQSLLIASFLSCFCLYAQAQKENQIPFVVVIDPGHGGKDSGATGINGLKEKDVNLRLAKEIIDLNRKQMKLDIYLTRSSDTLISLRDRTGLAKALKADVFISLHCNHANDSRATGTEIFVAAGNQTLNFTRSIQLAQNINNGFSERLGIRSRGVKFSNFQVLRESIHFFPSILIELCFLSNPDEAAYLSHPASFTAMAYLILNSLLIFSKNHKQQ